MAYKNGKTVLNKRDNQVRNALQGKDIASLLWIFLEDCVEDIEGGKDPRYGMDMFKNTLMQVANLQAKGIAKPATDTSKALADFLKVDAKRISIKGSEVEQDTDE